MSITVEKFDFDKFTTEKVKFALDIDREVFNVSEGLNNQYDQLDNSPLWRGKFSVEEYRELLWQQIKQHLPRYFRTGLKGFYEPNLVADSDIFRSIMQLAHAYRDTGRLKLIYISDHSHAQLIARCVDYLANQVLN